MSTVWTLITTVLGMLVVERVGITVLTNTARGRDWIIRHPLFHPNSISFVRMPMGVIAVVLWVTGSPLAAIIWFAAWMITDLTDGTIARNCNLGTESGESLDPLSDKLMYFPPLLYFAYKGALPWSWVGLLLVIDTVGQFSRLLVKKRAANAFGKAKTAFITILLTVTGLMQMGCVPVVKPVLLEFLTLSCTVLAFLSLYCKVIPDVWYANSLSLANLLCGLGAMWQLYTNHPVKSFILVFVGQFFDLFDGRMARKFGSTPHGAYFDDIADGTSFGLAIGLLVVHESGMGGLSWAVGVMYLVCVIYRLIRFLMPTKAMPAGVFQGLPSPAGAVCAGSAALLFHDHAVALVAVLLTSYLMISNLPYRHFGQSILPSLPKMARLLCLVFVLSLANISLAYTDDFRFAFSLFCFAISLTYVIGGLDFRLLRGLPPRTPAPAPDNL